jgi:FKBP-type peptidyl-prolyl cis-trans isomerase
MKTRGSIALLTALLLLFAACGGDDDGAGGTEATGRAGDVEGCTEGEEVTTESGLVIEDVTCGTGEEARRGLVVSVHYVGTLEDGKPFDSSRDRGQPFEFPLGEGQVIAGWDEGVAGMLVGGTRKLTIPPDLGYGEAGAAGVIPPNSTLLFEIELLGVEEPFSENG